MIMFEATVPVRMALVIVSMIVVSMIIMVVIMSVIVVIVIMVIAFEKIRLDIENTIEIEGIASQHFGNRNLAALGAVHTRIGIDAADARLDLGQFVRFHEVR